MYDVIAVIIDVKSIIEKSSVLQSQVGEQLIALKSFGLNVGLIAASQDIAVFDQVIGQSLMADGIHTFLIRDGGFLHNMFRMARTIRLIRQHHTIRYAYVRGIWGAMVLALANPWRRISYIYDVRGAVADETAARGSSRVKQYIYAALDSWGIRGAAQVTAVSQFLAKNIMNNYRKDKVHVIPCCVNFNRISVNTTQVEACRRAMGFNQSDIILVYSGGLSHYQQIPAMLDLWRRLLNEPDVRFLLITNDEIRRIGDIKDFNSRLRYLSLPRKEIPLTLSAANIGFMMRDARELNKAASPVKFAEYLAAGLAVVASPGTGDVSGLIEMHKIGVLVDPSNLDEGELHVRALIEQIRKERAYVRSRAIQIAQTRYDWRVYQDIYRLIYRC